MAKSNAIEEALGALKALRGQPPSDDVKRQLAKGLESKANIVAARVAELVLEFRFTDLGPDLQRSFERFLSGKAQDKGCIAKIAIARAAVELGLAAEEIYLPGLHDVPREPASPDAVAELRGLCIMGLVQMGHREALNEVVDILMEKDPRPQARVGAARALGASGREEAGLLLRFKLLARDRESDVLAECIHSLARLWAQKSLKYLVPYLHASDPMLRDNAALAIGGLRQPVAFHALQERWNEGIAIKADARPALLLGIAMTRLPEAVELLVSVVEKGRPDAAIDALEALAMYRHDQALRSRLNEIVAKRDSAEIRTAFTHALGSA